MKCISIVEILVNAGFLPEVLGDGNTADVSLMVELTFAMARMP